MFMAGGSAVGGTAREQILSAIDHITTDPTDTFTVSDVWAELTSRGTNLSERTVRTHITSRMCRDAPDNHGTTYDDLERVERGVYRLRGVR
jgi:hypothetical protein